MPSYRERLDALIAQGNPQESQATAPQLPSGTLPPEIAAIVNAMPQAAPEPAGLTVRGLRVNIPSSPTQVTRELMTRYAQKKIDATIPKAQRIPSAQVTILNNTKNSLDRLQELQQLYSENPDIKTGPTALYFRRQGPLATVGNLELQYGLPKEQAKRITSLALKTNQTLDQYRRAVTGAQAGFPEIKFLQSAQPDPSRHVRGNLEAALQAAIEEQQMNYQMMLDTLDKSGYDVKKFSSPTMSPSTETDERITVRDKSGKLFSLPKSQLQQAQAQGYTLQ